MGPAGTYTVFKSGDTDAGGMMQMGSEKTGVPSHWLSYIAVEDVDAKAAQISELGGQVMVPPTDIPKIGRFCVFQDPTAAVIAIITFLPPENS